MAQDFPEGIPRGMDVGAVVPGTVLGVDIAKMIVQVSLDGSDGFWVPASAGVYFQGQKVRLQRSAVDRGRVMFCLGPVDPGPEIVVGRVTAVNTAAGTLTVATVGGSYDLPFASGTYSVGTLVHVWRSAERLGMPVFVLGQQGNYAGVDPGGVSAGAGNPPQSVLREIVFRPQWSGSWRSGYSRWNTWNTDRYGGPSTLWQGSGYGSTAMTGLATYGDQIVNLGASSIESASVLVYRADTSVSTGVAPTLQPSTNGSQPGGAPTVAGATATGPSLTPEAGAWVDLPSGVLAGFLAGTYKGVALVGSGYGGFYGTAKGDGMLLKLQYKVSQ